MNNNESEDDLLNQLYLQSANEKPPKDLDQKILQEARAHHHVSHFAGTFKWQRGLSVAAVMVLSIYIFFDVSNDHSSILETEMFIPKNETTSPSPAMGEVQNLQRKLAPKKAKLKQQKKMVKEAAKTEGVQYLADDISGIDSDIQESTQSDMAEQRMFSAPAIPETKSVDLSVEIASSSSESELHEVNAAEKIIKQIQLLLANGKLEEAKELYNKFKQLFPNYPVPILIEKSFQKAKTIPYKEAPHK